MSSAPETPENPLDELARKIDEKTDQLAGTTTAGTVTSFSLDGAELVYEQWGAGDPLFVLIHGIGMGRKVFDGLAEILLPHGRVWAIDQPGYGDASEPPRTPTMERTADIVAALLRSRGENNVIVLGHSMGTQVATEVAVRHPDLVSRLILAAPTVDIAARAALPQMLRLARDLWGSSLRVLLLGGREYLRAGPNLARKMTAMLAHRPEDSYPRVAAPTLVLRGEDDLVAPLAWCEFVVDALPSAELVELPGHGHETLIRDPQPAASAVLDFVRRQRCV